MVFREVGGFVRMIEEIAGMGEKFHPILSDASTQRDWLKVLKVGGARPHIPVVCSRVRRCSCACVYALPAVALESFFAWSCEQRCIVSAFATALCGV